jgi:hypothetical protein
VGDTKGREKKSHCGKNAKSGGSDPTFWAFSRPKKFLGSLPPDTLVACSRFAAQGRDKQFVMQAALHLEKEKEERAWHY